MDNGTITKAPACTMLIFGAVGDLTKTLLMPAVYNLFEADRLDGGMRFLGLDHNDRDTDGWKTEIREALDGFSKRSSDGSAGADERAWSFIAERLEYVRFDFTADQDYDALAQRLAQTGNALFYLAVAPRFFEPIVAGLHRAGLLTERDGAFRRIIVEKPFGRDVESARELNTRLTALADESQLFRIDHFLGKEAVQGIPALRFANRFFEPLLNRDAVAGVQITAAETVGVAERGSFYETIGALRDMIPNHLLSLLTLVAMDEPSRFDADVVRDTKVKLLDAIRPIGPDDAARGQYGAGTVAGESVAAYRDEDNVAPDSRTETYAALRVLVDNDRWRGVPFYLRTGKRMSGHVTTIALALRTPKGPFDADPTEPHLLLLGIDPQRGLVQRFAAKRPGVNLQLGRADSAFRYEKTFDEPPNVGYEALLYHALCGDALLFQRADMIESEWTAVQPVLDAWEKSGDAPETYAAGSDGPPSADELLARNGDQWLPVAPLESLGTNGTAKPGSDRSRRPPDGARTGT